MISLSPEDEAAVQLIVDRIIGRSRMTDTEPPPVTAGACERGPVIPLVEAGGKRFEECIVCGLTLPWDRNLNHWFGFRVNCERKADAADS